MKEKRQISEKDKLSLITLDIETNIPHPKQAIGECIPFLVGIKEFCIIDGELQPGKYRYFRKDNFHKAVKHLKGFPGPVVGYNLLAFDYIVLFSQNIFDISPLIKHTVDLLDLFIRKVGTYRGLKLDKVCKDLFGEGKTLQDSGSLHEMWDQGKKEEVLSYSEKDCDLTARLWFELFGSSSLQILQHKIQVTEQDKSFLRGSNPSTTFKQWRKKNFKKEAIEKRIDSFQGIDKNPLDLAREYDRYVCKKTNKVFYSREIPSSTIPSGSDIKPRECPKCGDYYAHSAYKFKSSPIFEKDRLEKLWSLIRSYVQKEDKGHLYCESIGYQPIENGFPNFGISEDQFEEWLDSLKHDKRLQKFVPRFEKQTVYVSKRGQYALMKFAEENVW